MATGGSKGFTIFYQWWISTNNNDLDRAQFKIMNQSQGLGESSGVPVSVFVDTIGNLPSQQVKEMCGNNAQLQCQHARQ